MNENLIKEIDQTIEEICKCIKKNTNENAADIGKISEIANALAALVTARANSVCYKNSAN